MYWDYTKLLSYNKLFNFVIGNRGSGKTYGTKKLVVKDFLKNGNQFVYIRRYDTEIKALKRFFEQMENAFPNIEFNDVKGLRINGEECGYCLPLSRASKFKSISFEKVRTIIFDEFIVESGRQSYLPKEVWKFLDFYETISRMRDVRVIFLGNRVSDYNPYFTFFNIDLGNHEEFIIKEDIAVEIIRNLEYQEKKLGTRFGQLIKGTTYYEYAVENKSAEDSDYFIEKRPRGCKCIMSLMVEDIFYGVWQDNKTGMIYISNDFDKNQITIATDFESHNESSIFKRSEYMKQTNAYLYRAFDVGTVRFENQICKGAFIKFYKNRYM